MKKNRILYICLILLGLGLFACNSGNKKDQLLPADLIQNPASADGKSDAGALPVLQFEKMLHDFGSVCEGETVSFGFKFKNTGKSDLLIAKVTSSCGCTVGDYPKDPVKPGQDGVISVTFKSEGRKGIQNKTVTVLANTQPNIQTLTINAMVNNCK